MKPELLAPAGDKESFYAAVNNGADAVYLGLGRFNARMKAENFDAGSLGECINYAHIFGVKVYITVNTLVKQSETAGLIDEVSEAVAARADAFIVQDLGVAALLLKCFPGIVLHASTQAAVSTADGAVALEKLGFKRIVLARETKLKDIEEIKRKTTLEIEFFVHGALCVCFSGNCYLSAAVCGASGNRGLCKQLCRLSYEAYKIEAKADNTANKQAQLEDEASKKAVQRGYLLSARDLCLIDSLKELADAGVSSFKIEGRLRRSGYVGETVRIYRDAIDKTFSENLPRKPLNTVKKPVKNPSKTAQNMQKTVFFCDEKDDDQQEKDGFSHQKPGSSTNPKSSSTKYSALYPDNVTALKTAFSRGEYLSRAYLDEGTPDSIINKAAQNHVGTNVGEIKSVKPFKNLYEITIESCRELKDGDGIKLFENGVEKGSLGIGGVKKSGADLYNVITKTRAEKGWKVNLILDASSEKQATEAVRKINVDMELSAYCGKPIELKVCAKTGNSGNGPAADGGADNVSVIVTGAVAEEARTAPMSAEELKSQLIKTGGRVFEAADVRVGTDGVFVPKSTLNALRREALDKLLAGLSAYNGRGNIVVYHKKTSEQIKQIIAETSVYFDEYNILTPCYDNNKLYLRFMDGTKILVLQPDNYVETEVLKAVKESGLNADGLALQLPNLVNGRDLERLDAVISALSGKVKFLLAENLYGMKYSELNGFELIVGREANVTNCCSVSAFASLGARYFVPSAESDGGQGFDGVYPPLMTFAHCPYKTLSGTDCKHCAYKGGFIIKHGDRKYLVSRVRIANCYFKLTAYEKL